MEFVWDVLDYFVQLKVLMLKNLRLMLRGWKMTLFEVLVPAVFFGILFLLTLVPQPNPEQNIKPPGIAAGLLGRCHTPGKTCYPLVFAPSDHPLMLQVMHEVIRRSDPRAKLKLYTNPAEGLDHDGAIIGWPSYSVDPDGNDCSPDNERTNLCAWLVNPKNANRTLGAVVLDVNSMPPDQLAPIELAIDIYTNRTCPSIALQCQQNLYVVTRAVQDAALAVMTKATGGAPSPILSLRTTEFPVNLPPNDPVRLYIGLFLYIGVSFYYIILVYQLLTEKEKKLREGMRMMGLRSSMYWLSWLLTAQVIEITTICLTIAAGAAFQFAFVLDTNFFALLAVIWSFCFAMTQQTLMLSTLLPSTRVGIYVAVALFIIGLLLMLVCSTFGVFMMPILFESKPGRIVLAARWILTFLPYFNFSRAVFDINNVSYRERGISGPGFAFSDLWSTAPLASDREPFVYVALLWLIGHGIVCTLLTLYLDAVVPGNGGKRESLLFPLSPQYWGLLRRRPRLSSRVEAHADADVAAEYARAADPTADADAAVRVLGLRKVFSRIGPFGRNVAVQNFCAAVREGEVFCLLGHNGAGKTTTISILVGLFEPSAGDAFIFGHSVVGSMDKIRRVMGVCPQHDVLWDDMTAREHLLLFADLKRVPWRGRRRVIDELLEKVKLTAVQHKCVRTYSGGMKRRLSVAISLIGDPRVVFMDEVSSGLDPVSKRHIWDLIQDEKAKRVIFLTTHSMEEADVLSDRIAIMSEGQIRAIGSPLHLKNKFGNGYRVNVTAAADDEDAITRAKALVAAKMPAARLLLEAKEFLTYGVPIQGNVIVSFFLDYENDPEMRRVIRDASVSHATLEEVFVNVTSSTSMYKSYFEKQPPHGGNDEHERQHEPHPFSDHQFPEQPPANAM